jgi:putative permease
LSAHANSNPNTHCDTYTYSYSQCYAYSYCHGHAYGHAASDSYTEGSANASAPPVGAAGNDLTNVAARTGDAALLFLVIHLCGREDRGGRMDEHVHEDQHAPLSYHGAWRIVWLVFLLFIVWLILRTLQPVILLFALVFLLAMVLNPIVVWLEKHRVPRFAGVMVTILALMAITATIILFAIPPLSRQLQELAHSMPLMAQGIRVRIESLAQNYPAVREALPRTEEIADKIGSAAGTVGNILLRSTIGFVGGVASVVLAVLLLIFVLANPRPLVAAYLALTPDRYRGQARRTVQRLMRQMIAWARGVAINGVITGLSIGVLLWLIGVQPALIFGVFGFLGEFLPTIGAFLVSIPILLVALSMGATKFWLALLVIVVVYQVELNLLVPSVLGKEMRLHPVNILFFTLATAELFGLLGVFLAVPAAALVQIVIDEFYLQPRKPDYVALDREAAAIVEGER